MSAFISSKDIHFQTNAVTLFLTDKGGAASRKSKVNRLVEPIFTAVSASLFLGSPYPKLPGSHPIAGKRRFKLSLTPHYLASLARGPQRFINAVAVSAAVMNQGLRRPAQPLSAAVNGSQLRWGCYYGKRVLVGARFTARLTVRRG